MIDMVKARRDSLRWYILLTLNNARPIGAYEELVLATIQGIYIDGTQMEVRRELDYLGERDLIEVRRDPDGRWFTHLTRHGVDVVEYTVDCDAGIARPRKDW